MTLLLLLACAARGPQISWSPSQSLPPPELGELFAAQPPDALFRDAVARREDGDIPGALARLAWLRANGDRSPAVLYQMGIAHEVAEDFEAAIGAYELLLAENPGEYVLDAGFRRGLCLLELGHHEAALRQLRDIPEGIAFDRHDRYTLDIAVGIAALGAGREAEGVRLLTTSLAAVEGTGEVTWMAARGWVTLAEHSLAEAAALRLDVGERRQVKHLKARAALIAEAEAQLIHAVELEEPEWIMAGLLALGDAYMALHQDLTGAPPPRRLSEEQAALYTEQVAQRSAVLLTKAWNAYDQGLAVAGRFGLENRFTEPLRAAREAVPLP